MKKMLIINLICNICTFITLFFFQLYEYNPQNEKFVSDIILLCAFNVFSIYYNYYIIKSEIFRSKSLLGIIIYTFCLFFIGIILLLNIHNSLEIEIHLFLSIIIVIIFNIVTYISYYVKNKDIS